jgi:hypothetical protein
MVYLKIGKVDLLELLEMVGPTVHDEIAVTSLDSEFKVYGGSYQEVNFLRRIWNYVSSFFRRDKADIPANFATPATFICEPVDKNTFRQIAAMVCRDRKFTVTWDDGASVSGNVLLTCAVITEEGKLVISAEITSGLAWT